MATSGIYTNTENRNSIIRDAYIAIGQIDYEEAVPAWMVPLAERKINRIIPQWRTKGIFLWARDDCTLMLENGTTQYSLGPTTTDHWFKNSDAQFTALDGALASAATAVTVDSTTGMAAADNIGIELDDDTMHWTTIVSVDTSTTLTITTGVTDTAADDGLVVVYTSLAQRPLEILGCMRKDKWNNEVIVETDSKADYWWYANKATEGTVNRITYDPRLNNGTLYTYPTTCTSLERLNFFVQYPIEIFTQLDDEANFPEEAREALVYTLAERLAVDFKIDKETNKRVVRLAAITLNELLDFNSEVDESLFIEPRFR